MLLGLLVFASVWRKYFDTPWSWSKSLRESSSNWRKMVAKLHFKRQSLANGVSVQLPDSWVCVLLLLRDSLADDV